MKKILLVLAIVGTTLLSSCEGPEGARGPQGIPGPNAQVYEIFSTDFTVNAQGNLAIYRTFNQTFGYNLFDSDVILVYRLSGTIDANTPIWDQIPNTYYGINSIPGAQLHYDFDFSAVDFTIYAGGNYDLFTTPTYINDQTFRVVIVPGSFANKMESTVDFSDYNAVIKAYHIDDTHLNRK